MADASSQETVAPPVQPSIEGNPPHSSPTPEGNKPLDESVLSYVGSIDLSKLSKEEITLTLEILAGKKGMESVNRDLGQARQIAEAVPHTQQGYEAAQKVDSLAPVLKQIEKNEQQINQDLEKLLVDPDPERRALGMELKNVLERSHVYEIQGRLSIQREMIIERLQQENPNLSEEEINKKVEEDPGYILLKKQKEDTEALVKNFEKQRNELRSSNGTEIPPKVEPIILEMARVFYETQGKKALTTADVAIIKMNPAIAMQMFLKGTDEIPGTLGNRKQAVALVGALVRANMIPKKEKNDLIDLLSGQQLNRLPQVLGLAGVIALLMYMIMGKAMGEMGGGGGRGG